MGAVAFSATFIFISIGGVSTYYFSLPIWCFQVCSNLFLPSTFPHLVKSYTRTTKPRYFISNSGKARQGKGSKKTDGQIGRGNSAEAKGCWSVGRLVGSDGRDGLQGKVEASFLLNFTTTQYVTAVCEHFFFSCFVLFFSLKVCLKPGWCVCEQKE
ncbi:hypothetical protein B0H65DRAFT_124244 [Neurospora tetraspora]|uniref:Uncharacterized protein n=1 Tax=Neurospora tetraspora TaxID=94610 RepID=A0AAE0JLA7_9PEZI|nr:hypothetical protein B0H65DRAFT_124244 [Neurospora tetraspora]